MALSGELSDLSLAELIEFFCNQRKTGRLKVIYPRGPGYFYLQAGSVVHAEVGVLRGIEAVYYALTLPNASFKFSAALEPPERTINQPWTSVVLEGLRRMDEGIQPGDAFPPSFVTVSEDAEQIEGQLAVAEHKYSSSDLSAVPADDLESETEIAPMLWKSEPEWLKKPWGLGVVVGAVVLILAAVGIPWAWYAHSQGAKAMNQPKASVGLASEAASSTDVKAGSDAPAASARNEAANSEAEALAAKRLREARAKEKAKAQDTASANPSSPTASAASSAARPAPNSAASKKVTVQVSYDENGRVTQASGADPTALRIARQKRFPAGKAGSATITIPIN